MIGGVDFGRATEEFSRGLPHGNSWVEGGVGDGRWRW